MKTMDYRSVLFVSFISHHSFSVRAVYNELHNTLMAIDEHEDLRWWKNTHGPGMPTDWPHFQVGHEYVHLQPFLLLKLMLISYFDSHHFVQMIVRSGRPRRNQVKGRKK